MRAEGMAVLLLFLMAVSSGCIKVSNSAENGQLEVYVMLEDGGSIFDVSLFNITVNGVPLKVTNVPVMVSTERPGKVSLHITGEVMNWNLDGYHLSESIRLTTPIPGRYLLALEVVHELGSFYIMEDRSFSGYVSRGQLQRLAEGNEGAITAWIKRNLPYEKAPFQDELDKNRKLRAEYIKLWKDTGNISYLQAYRDLEYHLKTLGFLAKTGKLTAKGFEILLLSMKTTDYYYSMWNRPGRKSLVLVFSNESPYSEVLRIKKGPFRSHLPFVYYPARGFNLCPISALHWAQIYYGNGHYSSMLAILNELEQFAEIEDQNGTAYAVFYMYFPFQNSSVPWVSGYAQSMAVGMYTLAYKLTGREDYRTLARLFLNSFNVHFGPDVFIASTEYEP